MMSLLLRLARFEVITTEIIKFKTCRCLMKGRNSARFLVLCESRVNGNISFAWTVCAAVSLEYAGLESTFRKCGRHGNPPISLKLKNSPNNELPAENLHQKNEKTVASTETVFWNCQKIFFFCYLRKNHTIITSCVVIEHIENIHD